MARNPRSIFFLFSALLIGCGDGNDDQSGNLAAVEEVDSFGICQMLTDAQVASVLPEHDGGEVVHSGGSLMEGVDSYQCSYTSEANGGYKVFTVVVSVASTPELLSRIRPSNFLYGEDDRPDIADGAFINDKMDDEMDITVIKGLNKIDMDLLSGDAQSKRQQMIELATIVAAKL